MNDAANENDDDNDYKLNNIKTIASRSFEYKTKITKTSLILSRLDPEVVVPWKYEWFFWDISICLWLTLWNRAWFDISKNCI